MFLGYVSDCEVGLLDKCKTAVVAIQTERSGPEVIKLFHSQLSWAWYFCQLINVKMPTIVGILTFMSRKNSILSLSEPENCWISWYFHTCEHLKFHAQLSWAWKKFNNLGASFTLYVLIYIRAQLQFVMFKVTNPIRGCLISSDILILTG